MLAAELGSYVSQVECETVVDASVALLRAPPEVLRNFRVIGVVGSVLLVVDTATEGSFIIKVLAVLTTVFQVNLDWLVPRWFLANVNSRSRYFTFTFAICYRPSVCRLSVVCNVRAPYSGGSNFRQYFYGIRYPGHPLTFTKNFTEIVPGEPLRRGS